MINSYNMEESKIMSIIMHSLGCEWLRFVQTLADSKKESARQSLGYLRY